jgi:hypothetical protein
MVTPARKAASRARLRLSRRLNLYLNSAVTFLSMYLSKTSLRSGVWQQQCGLTAGQEGKSHAQDCQESTPQSRLLDTQKTQPRSASNLALQNKECQNYVHATGLPCVRQPGQPCTSSFGSVQWCRQDYGPSVRRQGSEASIAIDGRRVYRLKVAANSRMHGCDGDSVEALV